MFKLDGDVCSTFCYRNTRLVIQYFNGEFYFHFGLEELLLWNFSDIEHVGTRYTQRQFLECLVRVDSEIIFVSLE